MNRILVLLVFVSFSLVGCGASVRHEVAVPFDFDAAIAKATPQVSVHEPFKVDVVNKSFGPMTVLSMEGATRPPVVVSFTRQQQGPTAPHELLAEIMNLNIQLGESDIALDYNMSEEKAAKVAARLRARVESDVPKLQAQIDALLAQLESMGGETDYVEVSTMQEMQEQINSLLRQIWQARTEGWETYLVESGDTLGALLVARGISPSNEMLEEVVRKNGLESAHRIIAGQKLVLPKGKADATPAPPRHTVVRSHLFKDAPATEAEVGVEDEVPAPPTVVETLHGRFANEPARAQSAETAGAPEVFPVPELPAALGQDAEDDQADQAAVLGLTTQVEELESKINELKMERDGARHALGDERTKFFWVIVLMSLGIMLAAFAMWWFLTRRFNGEREQLYADIKDRCRHDLKVGHQVAIIKLERNMCAQLEEKDKRVVELEKELEQQAALSKSLLEEERKRVTELQIHLAAVSRALSSQERVVVGVEAAVDSELDSVIQHKKSAMEETSPGITRVVKSPGGLVEFPTKNLNQKTG